MPQGQNLGFGIVSYVIALFSMLFMFLFESRFKPRFEEELHFSKDVFIAVTILLLDLFLGVFQKSSFIYFQF